MDLTFHLCSLVFLSSLVRASSTGCSLKDEVNQCSFTVDCEDFVTIVNRDPYYCETPNVTFVIRGSVSNNLNPHFFQKTTFDLKVSTIRAINNTWSEISPSTFSVYSQCSTMDLSSNSIKNIENFAFKNMRALNFLNLSRNAIELLNNNSFSIHKICRLTNLDLSYNLLTHISSAPFQTLTCLSYLAIHHNRLQTISPDCFLELKSIETLDLNNNQLTTLDNALANLKSLYRLDVSSNNLIELSDYEFNQTTHLKYLHLSNNALEDIKTNCFANALDLTEIDLRNNKIKSWINDTMFMHNSQLHEIYLSNNSIQCVHDDAFIHNAKNIKVHLEQNPLKENISKEIFCVPAYEKTENFTGLQLKNYNITTLENNFFPEFPNVVNLNLSHNFIHTIGSNAFLKFFSLNVLDISNNNLINLNFFNNSLRNLTELYLNINEISVILKGTFVNQKKLVKLDLSMNYIHTIQQFSLPLDQLEYLNVAGNRLEILKKNVVCPSEHLKLVDLSNSRLTTVDNEAFVECPLLATVNLSRNSIEDIGPNNFIKMDSLHSLDLYHNRLRTLKLTHLFLRHLNLSFNLIADNIFLKLSLNLVESIDLSNNYLGVFDEQTLYSCSLLKSLILDYNEIPKMDVEKLLKTLPYLESLSVIGNDIECAEIIEDHKVKSISVDKIFEKDILPKLHLQCGQDFTTRETTPAVDDGTTTVMVPLSSASYTTDIVGYPETHTATDAKTDTVTEATTYNVYNTVVKTVNQTGIGDPATVGHKIRPDNSSSLLVYVITGCVVLTMLIVVVGLGWYFYNREHVYDLTKYTTTDTPMVELNR